MYWKLFAAREYAALPTGYRFPSELSGPSTEHTLVFALEDASGRLHALLDPGIQPDSDGETSIPCGVYTLAELSRPEAWRAILQHYPAHRVDLAAYQATHPEFPPEALLLASGGKQNFKSLSDWRELGALDAQARELGRLFDLPLNVLRLWARLADADRDGWHLLFREHPFSKNYIRDIVLDLYDLDAAKRGQALELARDHARRWLARETRSRAYPAGEVRDLVRELRSPAIETLRRKLIQLRREMGLPKGMQLEWPVDLEQRRLSLRLDFESMDDLERLLASTGEADFQAGARKILDEL